MDRTRLTRMFIPALMCMAAATPCAATASAETADDRYILYINTYSQMAVDQQAQFGIPASITLAQGLLESAAGRSTLAREGNNHFGIKCHKGWEGKSMLRDDDAPGECFRVYGSAAESYRDHSLFLSRERYRPLFSHDVTDYASWARGLSRCGYATDPNYASRLIAIIERYALYTYDTRAGREAEEITEFIWQQMRKTHPVRKARGLHYVIASPGDTYSSIAKEFRITIGNPPRFQVVYLFRRHLCHDIAKAVVKQGFHLIGGIHRHAESVSKCHLTHSRRYALCVQRVSRHDLSLLKLHWHSIYDICVSIL